MPKIQDVDISVSVTMPKTLVKRLDKEAEDNGRCSRAAVIRQLLIRALEKQEKTA